MTLGMCRAVSLTGIEGSLIDIEADVSAGLPATRIVGLADTAVAQAEHRVRVALGNTGQPYPDTRLTVNLVPAGAPKHGTAFDAAIAVAVLIAQGIVPPHPSRDTVVLGELTLEGRIRPIPGVLPALLGAVRGGVTKAVVPRENLPEARFVDDIQVAGVDDLIELIRLLGAQPHPRDRPPAPPSGRSRRGEPADEADELTLSNAERVHTPPDLSEIVGQHDAVEALIVAATGRHHLMLTGSPGAGKSMLANSLATLLPPLSRREQLEVTAVRSLTSRTGVCELPTQPPFEAPHHSLTMAGLIGGGSSLRPGLVSLSAHGVLFLDEAPEFRTHVLDSLRQCLETGTLTLHRAGVVGRLPADFQLVMAANPCPCGYATEPESTCTCTPSQRRRYLARLSGPLLDRVDLRVGVGRVRSHRALIDEAERLTSAQAQEQVARARAASAERLRPFGHELNSQVSGETLRGRLRLTPQATATLDRALDLGTITLRGYFRLLRIAWTLCDLAGDQSPDREHIARAMSWRGGGEHDR
ncbi:MAG: YifB family Mg chelatase-like AAA ATPase [Pseudoclavibacter sp.]